MNSFFKMVFASCLGVALGLVLLTFIGISILGAMAGQSGKPKAVAANSVLHLKFDKVIPEHTNNTELQSLTDLQDEDLPGLTDIGQKAMIKSKVFFLKRTCR